jgi:hypothetical protein
MVDPRRTNTQTEGRHIPRGRCGGYRRPGIGQHRRLERCDAQGPSRIHVLDLDTPSIIHALAGVASHQRRVSASLPETDSPGRAATAECDAPSAFVRIDPIRTWPSERTTADKPISVLLCLSAITFYSHFKSQVPAANQRPEPVVARFAHPCF